MGVGVGVGVGVGLNLVCLPAVGGGVTSMSSNSIFRLRRVNTLKLTHKCVLGRVEVRMYIC